MIEELAKRYAYETMTCPGSTNNIDEVLEEWASAKHHRRVGISGPFKDYDPEDLLTEFYSLRDTFLDFAKEIREKG